VPASVGTKSDWCRTGGHINATASADRGHSQSLIHPGSPEEVPCTENRTAGASLPVVLIYEAGWLAHIERWVQTKIMSTGAAMGRFN
jgi:hypothetical protein